MSSRRSSVFGAAVVLAGIVATVAVAQEASKVAFATSHAFLVNDKEMPAGRYEIEVQRRSAAMLILRNLETRQSMPVKWATRLADLGGAKPLVVFDKNGDAYYLSELHLPSRDGFVIQGAPGEHSHVSVTAQE